MASLDRTRSGKNLLFSRTAKGGTWYFVLVLGRAALSSQHSAGGQTAKVLAPRCRRHGAEPKAKRHKEEVFLRDLLRCAGMASPPAVVQENSLNRHGKGDILGTLNFALESFDPTTFPRRSGRGDKDYGGPCSFKSATLLRTLRMNSAPGSGLVLRYTGSSSRNNGVFSIRRYSLCPIK